MKRNIMTYVTLFLLPTAVLFMASCENRLTGSQDGGA